MWRGSSAQSVVSVLTTSSSSTRHTCVASYFIIFVIITEAEHICHSTRIVQPLARSNRLQPARSSHFPRSVGFIIGTNVAPPDLSHSDERTRGRFGEILRSLLIAFEAHILKRSVVALHRVDPRSRLRVRDLTPIEHGRLSRQLDEGGRRSDSFLSMHRLLRQAVALTRHANAVPLWWICRIALNLLDDLWASSLHVVLPTEGPDGASERG